MLAAPSLPPPLFRACLVSVGGPAETRHGLQPVSADGFQNLAAVVSDYTGHDTAAVDLAAPAFTTAWFA